MKELVSVIMPCYNDGQYIRESIASVWAQTYPYLELVIIDDGSDDQETNRILAEIEKDERCLLLHTNHVGPSGARNHGISEASGTYILPLDSDDTIDPTYIEKAVKKIEEKPEYGVVYCQADLFGEANGHWNLPDYSFEQMLRDNVVFITALFYKADWEAVGGFKTNMTAGMEDYDFWIGLMELGREIYQLPETLFHYRIKKKSRTTSFMSDIDNVKKMYEHIYDNHPAFYGRYRVEYEKQLREMIIELIFYKNKLEESNEIYQRIKKNPIIKMIVKKIIRV